MQNSVPINIWASKHNLSFFLLRIKEYKQLDEYVKLYLKFLGHRIIRSPSKGPYGEQGKDIVAEEDEGTRAYCSYVVKAGALHGNLYGKFGILKQMRDALLIPLEESQYRNSPRTVVVIYNEYEGYRGAIKVFEQEKKKIQKELGKHLLLREIQRWDIEELTNRFFKKRQDFQESGRMLLALDMLHEFKDIGIDFEKKATMILSRPLRKKHELKTLVKETLGSIRKIKDNYAFEQLKSVGEYDD
jgi:hypothetical protein